MWFRDQDERIQTGCPGKWWCGEVSSGELPLCLQLLFMHVIVFMMERFIPHKCSKININNNMGIFSNDKLAFHSI